MTWVWSGVLSFQRISTSRSVLFIVTRWTSWPEKAARMPSITRGRSSRAFRWLDENRYPRPAKWLRMRMPPTSRAASVPIRIGFMPTQWISAGRSRRRNAIRSDAIRTSLRTFSPERSSRKGTTLKPASSIRSRSEPTLQMIVISWPRSFSRCARFSQCRQNHQSSETKKTTLTADAAGRSVGAWSAVAVVGPWNSRHIHLLLRSRPPIFVDWSKYWLTNDERPRCQR